MGLALKKHSSVVLNWETVAQEESTYYILAGGVSDYFRISISE